VISPDHFRAFARRPTSLPAAVQSEVLGWDLPAELIDLGIGGACVVIGESLTLGTTVRLRIDAPQLWEPLLVPTRVAWTIPSGTVDTGDRRTRIGLRFEVESPGALLVLAELIGPTGTFL